MTIEYNKVTWYSKLLALVLFVALPFIGFSLGVKYQKMRDAGFEGRRILQNQLITNNSQPATDITSWETILSTFKVIDPTETSTWKTYRNEKYRFEFKHPSYISFLETQPQFSDSKIYGKPVAEFKMDIPNDFYASGGSIYIYPRSELPIYDQQWVVFDPKTNQWRQTRNIKVGHYIQTASTTPFVPEKIIKTFQGTPIYGEFGYGDAGFTILYFVIPNNNHIVVFSLKRDWVWVQGLGEGYEKQIAIIEKNEELFERDLNEMMRTLNFF